MSGDEELEGVDFDPHLLEHGRIFDLKAAAKECGLEFDMVSENNFEDIVKGNILGDYFNLRKAYHNKVFQTEKGVRFLAHKLKSPFGYIYAKDLEERFKEMQDAVDQNNPDIGKIYKNLVKDMNVFFEELYKFSKEVNREIYPQYVEEFNKLNKECDLNDQNDESLNSNANKNNINANNNNCVKEDDKLKNGNCIGNGNMGNKNDNNNTVGDGNNNYNNNNGHNKNISGGGEEIALGDVLTNGKIRGDACCGTDCNIF